MERQRREIVLLTGSSGFLGQHVLDLLCEIDDVLEIRALDKVPPREETKSKHRANTTKKVKFYHRDLLEIELCREAFREVDVVLHCAALVTYEFPANKKELRLNNVTASKNVIELCIEENVERLVHCSTTEVTLQSCFKGGIIAVVVYCQESRLLGPKNKNRLIFGDYAASKLEAEKLILDSNGLLLNNGKVLRTVALRPTYLYGEGDTHLIPTILKAGRKFGHGLLRFSGARGKQQMTYVGNAAWAIIRASETLRKKPEAIAGLPVNIVDDSSVQDLICFCERAVISKNHRFAIPRWPIPLPLSYMAASILEILANFGFLQKFQISPCSIVAYLGSVILYNGSRAAIHMDYYPKYSYEESFAAASQYYSHLSEVAASYK